MASGNDAGGGRLSCSATDRKGPPAGLTVRALDWPLSKDEKRLCAMKLFQQEVEASADQLDEQSEQIDELHAEIKVLRRLSTCSTAAGSVSPASGEAPDHCAEAELRVPGPCEETLLSAVQAYDGASQRSHAQPNRSPEQIAKFYGGCEDHAADFWGCVADKDDLTPLEAVMWLARSLPAPILEGRSRRWRATLLQSGHGRSGFEELRARAWASAEAQTLRLEAERELRRTFRGDEFMESPGVPEAIVEIAQTISAPKGDHLPGATHIAALLMYGLLPGGATLEEAQADAFWCFFQLQTNKATSSTDRRAKRLQELLRTFDEPLCEVLTRQGLIFVAARLGEALFASGGFAAENCAQLWDAMLNDAERFAFSDWLLCALILLKRFQLLRISDDAAQLAEALQNLPRIVPVERTLRLAAALRAAARRRQRRETKASRAGGRVHSPLEEDAPAGPLQILGSFFGRAREKGVEALEVTRSVARCAWRPERCCRATAEPLEKFHEEEMQPLRRRNTTDSSKTD